MSFNSFGHLFRFTTWGESHGSQIGCVVDGCPPQIELEASDIQKELDRRKPGQSKYTTQRKEADQVEIVSGVFQDEDMPKPLTTGTPISLIIQNTDQRSKDYGEIKHQYRPGHGDFTYDAKYGLRDYRGGGRTSARETAMRVAAGAIAKKIIPDINIKAYITQIGEVKIDPNKENWDYSFIDQNPFFTPDRAAVEKFDTYLTKIRKNGLSAGAVVEIIAQNMPIGLGAPIYKKLDSEIAQAMMTINAVKGVEFGDGFATAALTGKSNGDEIFYHGNTVRFGSNHAGGILAGVSTGQNVVVRIAIKPTSSMLEPMRSINRFGEEVEVVTKGRHDPCVGIRAVPVAEAMMACVLADQYLMHRAQCGEISTDWKPFSHN